MRHPLGSITSARAALELETSEARNTPSAPWPHAPGEGTPELVRVIARCCADVGALATAPPPTRAATAKGVSTAVPNVFITQLGTNAMDKTGGKPASPRLVEQFAGARGYAQSVQRVRRAVTTGPEPAGVLAGRARLPARFVRAETMTRQRIDRLCSGICAPAPSQDAAFTAVCEGLPAGTADILEKILRPMRQTKPPPKKERPAMLVAGPAFAAAFERHALATAESPPEGASGGAAPLWLRSTSLRGCILGREPPAERCTGRTGLDSAAASVQPRRTVGMPHPPPHWRLIIDSLEDRQLERRAVLRAELPKLPKRRPRNRPPPEVVALQPCPVRVLLNGHGFTRVRAGSCARGDTQSGDANAPRMRKAVSKLASSKSLANKMSVMVSSLQVDVPAPVAASCSSQATLPAAVTQSAATSPRSATGVSTEPSATNAMERLPVVFEDVPPPERMPSSGVDFASATSLLVSVPTAEGM